MFKTRRMRPALTAGMTFSMSVLAIAGCQSPSTAPAVPSTGGAAQAEAYPGTTGNVYPASIDEAPARYVAAPTSLKLASVVGSPSNNATAAATDGNAGSAWASGNATAPAFTLNLAVQMEVTALTLKATPSGTYTVDVTSNGSTWTRVLSNQRSTTWGIETKALPANTLAKAVRITFSNGGKAVQVFEAGLKGGPAPVPTPAPTIAPAAGGLLSVVATSAASGFAAARAIDGNTNTEWQSGSATRPALTVDRGSVATLSALDVKVNPGPTFDIQVSDTGATWRTVLAGQKTASWNVERKALPGGTTGRYVRLQFTTSGASVMVFEASAVGGSGPTPTSAPTTAPTSAPTMAPTTAPTVAPTVAPTMAPVNGPTIQVSSGTVLHRAYSTVLGTNRNHVTGDFPSGAAKMAKMRELTPTWGGGKYLYRIGHGPTDGRNDYSYMTGFHFEQAWNQLKQYPYDDLREGLKEANTMGMEQFHVVNFGTSDPDEAGRYVSYLNKAGDANRAKYPIGQQNVRMFELGNEIPWSMVRGHDKWAPNETVYAQRAKLFAEKMRANSDVPIQIGAVASINSNWMGNGWSGGATTVKNIMQTMGNQVDFLTYHGYPSWPLAYANGDRMATMAQNEWNRQKLEKEIKPAIKQYANGRDVWIANTEFFTHFYNDVTKSRGLYGALFAADTLTLAFNQDIRAAVEFCFEHKDMADAAFFFGNNAENTTAIFKFQKMLAEHWGDEVVQTTAQQIPEVTAKGVAASIQMPKLAYAAAKKGSTVYVMVTHRTSDSDVKANVALDFNPKAITAYTLTDPAGWEAANATVTTSNPSSLNGYNFKKASVTIFEIQR